LCKINTNDSRIKTASRQLRQGRISTKSFLLRSSFIVAGSEERMRYMALGQNNVEEPEENLFMNDGKSILIAVSFKICLIIIY